MPTTETPVFMTQKNDLSPFRFPARQGLPFYQNWLSLRLIVHIVTKISLSFGGGKLSEMQKYLFAIRGYSSNLFGLT